MNDGTKHTLLAVAAASLSQLPFIVAAGLLYGGGPLAYLWGPETRPIDVTASFYEVLPLWLHTARVLAAIVVAIAVFSHATPSAALDSGEVDVS